MIRGCIFDADGTILDSMKLWENLGQKYLLMEGKNPEKDLNQILYPMTMEESSAYLKEHYLPELSEKEIQNGFLKLIRKGYESEVQAKKGAVFFIHKLHATGIPMTVVTANDPVMISYAFERLGILDCFCRILDTDSMHTDKRHPDIYLKACEIMHTAIEKTAVFEDALEPLKTAGKAGFPVCAVEDDSNLADREKIQSIVGLSIYDFTEKEKLEHWFQQ